MYSRELSKIVDRREMLRVKVKSLAEEAKIIRKEERRSAGTPLRHELREHRVGIVRLEARHAGLAYGLIRGVPYEKMEPVVGENHKPDWEKVRKMVKKYGPVGFQEPDCMKK